MWKPISKQTHGLIDYTYAALVPLLPELAGFSNIQSAKLLCRGLGAGALSYSLLTKARWGLIRVLPFKSHLLIDVSVSCLALAAPWLLSFSRHTAARNTLLLTGLSGLAAACLTAPSEKESSQERYLFI
jgi:hypothetical protein